MIALKSDTKWQGKPIYTAIIDPEQPTSTILVQTNPEAGFTLGQQIEYAELGNVPGDSNGFTQWQNGSIAEMSNGKIFIERI